MDGKKREVEIAGGTFALCLWLFFITWNMGNVSIEIRKLRRQLNKPIKIEIVEPSDVNDRSLNKGLKGKQGCG